jgi:hypothetical protein
MVNKYGEKIPNLFIVGAPKCGTTSLHYWLSQHPEIFMSEPKEPKFFCTDFHRKADNSHHKKVNKFKYRDLRDYLDIFKEEKKQSITGGLSTRYFYLKK